MRTTWVWPSARRYTLKLVRDRSAVTCTIAREGTVYGSLDYTLTKPERRAFGSGKKTGHPHAPGGSRHAT